MLRRLITLATALALVAVTLTPTGSAAAEAGLRFTEPTKAVLNGLVDLEVDAPADTTSVSFFLDDTRLAEVTDLYSRQTETPPVWRTATDAGWFTPGRHTLRAVAQTPDGHKTTTKRVVTRRARPPRGVTPLTGGWRFAPAGDLPDGALVGDVPPAAKPGYSDGHWTDVVVPDSFGALDHTWNDDSGLLVAYRRTVHLSHARRRERTALVFESCFFSCRYFVNGKPVGSSTGGYLPTRLDVTDAVHRGTNTIVVVADNRYETMGKLSRPVRALYWNWGGLLQEVRMERTPAVTLTETRVEGALDGTLTLRPTGVNGTRHARRISALVTVTGPHGHRVLGPRRIVTTVPSGGGAVDPIELHIENPKPWNLDHPRLYTVRLRPLGIATWHTLTERTGFRQVEVEGEDLYLNGEVVRDLQGFDRHADYPGLGRTQPSGLADREMKRLHDKGFRIFRPAHYPTTPAELDAADEYGLLVIEEINNVTSLSGETLAKPDVHAFAKRQLDRMIDRDRSHPSVIAWSVGNENATHTPEGADYVRDVIAYGRSLDPNRLYTEVSNHGTGDRAFEYEDFVAVNHYAGWYSGWDLDAFLTSLQDKTHKPVLISEYGAEGVYRREGLGRGTEWYQAYVVDEHNRRLAGRKHFIGKMYWTSTEFWCSPTWGSGQNPDPVPPFHTKALRTLFRQPKLSWRVMFSPVRITSDRPVLEAAPGEQVTLSVPVTIADVGHHGAHGTVVVDPPEGFAAGEPQAFQVDPDGTTTVTVRLTGALPADGDPPTNPGFVRAVIDSDTEALPLPLTVRRADTEVSPASDDFGGDALDPHWKVIRPDPTGWDVDDGALRLSTRPGSEIGADTAKNLLVRTNGPTHDLTAVAKVRAPELADDYQQLDLLLYRDDDNWAKIDLAHISGRRFIELYIESDGEKATRAVVPYSADTARLRLVRRGDTVTGEYSGDGEHWVTVGHGTLGGPARVALQAVGGSTDPPTTDIYVDDLKVLVSGGVTVGTAETENLMPTHGTSTVSVPVSNDTATPAAVTATVDTPEGWSAKRARTTLAPFSTSTLKISVTPPAAPTVATLPVRVSATDHQVYGHSDVTVVTVPDGEAVPVAWDAGCPDNAVYSRYEPLTPDTAAWVGAPPSCRDRGGPDSLRRDIVTSSSHATLRVPIPAGKHDVYVLVGDPSYATDPMTISVGGTVVARVKDSLPTGASRWLRVPVDGGSAGRSVDLTFTAEGGYWRFGALALLL